MFFNALTFTIAAAVHDFGLVLSVLGATMSTMVILLLPGLFYYNLPRMEEVLLMAQDYKWKKGLALGMFCLGWIVVIVSLWSIFSPSSESGSTAT